jgi:hypothetical protein
VLGLLLLMLVLDVVVKVVLLSRLLRYLQSLK